MSETKQREWLVIESSMKKAIFATPEDKQPRGYIPRDAAEKLLGRTLGGGKTDWFTQKESEAMRDHPEWRTTLAEIDADCLAAEEIERAKMWNMQ